MSAPMPLPSAQTEDDSHSGSGVESDTSWSGSLDVDIEDDDQSDTYWEHPLRESDTRTFHQFGELPTGLQIKVWDLAASSLVFSESDHLLYYAVPRTASDTQSGFAHFAYSGPHTLIQWLIDIDVPKNTYLLASCNLARQIGLQALKREVQISVLPTPQSDDTYHDVKQRNDMRHLKQDIIVVLDRLNA